MHDQQIGQSDIRTLDGEDTVLCDPAIPGWLAEKRQNNLWLTSGRSWIKICDNSL
jgi:hypothetical protein